MILDQTGFVPVDHSWDGRKLTVRAPFRVYTPVVLRIG